MKIGASEVATRKAEEDKQFRIQFRQAIKDGEKRRRKIQKDYEKLCKSNPLWGQSQFLRRYAYGWALSKRAGMEYYKTDPEIARQVNEIMEEWNGNKRRIPKSLQAKASGKKRTPVSSTVFKRKLGGERASTRKQGGPTGKTPVRASRSRGITSNRRAAAPA